MWLGSMDSRAVAVLLLTVVLSACTGGPETGFDDPSPTDAAHARPLTLDERLNATEHVRIAGRATLEWEFDNATADAPEVATTLIHLMLPVEEMLIEKDNSPLLVAFVPRTELEAATSCAAPPEATHHYFRPQHGDDDDDVGNLTDPYDRGWYHAIVVADQPATITITFGADDHFRPRTQTPDDSVSVDVRTEQGGRQMTDTVGDADRPWIAWAAHQIDGNGFDGGRQQSLDIGAGCAADSAGGGFLFAGQSQTLAASAAGNGTTAEVAAEYAPNQGATAPEMTTLTIIQATLAPIVAPPPGETPADGNATASG